MPKPLIPLVIESPGFRGLNTQASGSVLPPGWATKLDNVVFDEIGRIASRGGSRQVNATVIPSSPTVRSIHEYIDSSNNKLNIVAADNKIYKEVSGVMTDISGTITTPTADNWQFANFNDWCVGFQAGHAPIVLTSVGGTFANSGGTQYNGNMCLAAYGRIWTALNGVLYYSDLLINNFAGGTSGNFDLASYWPNGMDEAVALADFNGFLIVLGKNSIIVYQNPSDPASTMSIVEGINGIGCIARDSVQLIGKELLFLSSSGVRTLGRVIQEKSMPISDMSKNVRDDLMNRAVFEAADNIKSVYNSKDGFYLISLPLAGISFVFDLKFLNDDGSAKITEWDYAPTALMYSQDLTMYMSRTAGYLSTYADFNDENDTTGVGGSTYTVSYEGVWVDFGEKVSPLIKILKKVSLLSSGKPGGLVNFKWAVDYSDGFTERQLSFSSTTLALFGVAKYGIDVYNNSGTFELVKASLSRSGQVVKFGFTTTIDGAEFALQRINIQAKAGRIGL